MLTLITIVVFYVFLCLLIIYITRKHHFALSRTETFVTFGFKTLIGCAYGYIFLHFYNGDDTWGIHLESLKEWNLLQNNPGQFFQEYSPETAIRNAKTSGNFLSLYLADLEYCLLVKTIGLFNVISRGNYYVNVVLLNFIFFWGHYWLFKTSVREFPEKRRLLLLVIFFLPTSLFWLSGIRGDGLLFFFFSLTIFYFHRWIQYEKNSGWIFTLAGIAGLMIFRSAVAILLIPGLLSWWLVIKQKRKVAIAFVSVYAIFLLMFFATSLLPEYNALKVVSEKQTEFFELRGNTRYKLNPLDPSVTGFVITTPQAFLNTFLRPFIWEAKGILQLFAALGILLFWMAALLSLRWRTKLLVDYGSYTPLLVTLMVFAFFNYLLIGFTVPFPGAIVRYKAIAELCFFTGFAILLDQKKLHIKK